MIVVGTPTLGLIEARTVACLIGLCRYPLGGIQVEWKPLGCTFLPSARAQLVQYAMQEHATHLLFVDSDMTFPPESLRTLLAFGQPLIGANYRRRNSPGHGFTAMKDGQEVTSVGQGALGIADYVGLGLYLIDLQVFRGLLPHEWFPADLYHGEDAGFFASMKRQGYDCLIDHDLSQRVGHLGTTEYRV